MYSDLFINILILVSFIFVGGQLVKDVSIANTKSKAIKVGIGIGGGILGIILMIYTIRIENSSTIFDLRFMAILITHYVAGLLPSLITGLIIAIFREMYFGISISSIWAIINIVEYIVAFEIVKRHFKNKQKRWSYMVISAIGIIITTFFALLKEIPNFYQVLAGYLFISLLSSIGTYYLINYAIYSNELYRQYKKDSFKDFLTGLNNTRQFDITLNNYFISAKENNERLSCLMIDIDHFKKVNDTYGHSSGDEVLKELANILSKETRKIDIISRLGGEEFCALLVNTDIDSALQTATRICNTVREHKFYVNDEKYINITISIGISTFPDTVNEFDELVKQADDALYKAKHSGRNRVCTPDVCT